MIPALLGVLAACNSNQPAPQPSSSGAVTAPVSTQPATTPPAKPPVNEADAFPEGQYQVEFERVSNAPHLAPVTVVKAKLTPSEEESYRKAAAAAGGTSHVHVDAKQNQLEFSADKSSGAAIESHVTADAGTIAVPKGVPAKKIVASQAARQLLEKRATP